MGLEYHECHSCFTGYESEYLHHIYIKLYDESVLICENCRLAKFTKEPRAGYIDLIDGFTFYAEDGSEFTDFSDLSEYLETHPQNVKATNKEHSIDGIDKFMPEDNLYELCERFSWKQLSDHDEDNTKWVPTNEFWNQERRQISYDLERLKKRQKQINDIMV